MNQGGISDKLMDFCDKLVGHLTGGMAYANIMASMIFAGISGTALSDTVALGGNLIMNVGPTARGYLDERAQSALQVYADWMKYNSRSIYGCTMAEPEFTAPADCRLTQSQDGKRLYLHLFAYPFLHLSVKGLKGKVKYAQFLHDGSEILVDDQVGGFGTTQESGDEAVFHLPAVKPNCLVPVIEVFLD